MPQKTVKRNNFLAKLVRYRKYSGWVLSLLVFASALLFRVTNLDLIEFKADEAMNLFLASRPLFGHPMPPATTASSIGVLNPPLLNYLLFPIAAISTDPIFISGVIGLINSLAILFFFLIVKKYYGTLTALISSLLLSFSPWMILFSRKIWAQDFILPLFIPVFYSLHKIILDKDQKYWLPYTLFSLLLVQIHQASILYLLPLTVLIFLFRVRISIRYILPGLILGLIPFIPYINFEIIHNCPDCRVISDVNSRLGTQRLTVHFIRPLQIVSQGNFQSETGSDMLTFKNEYPIAYESRQIFYLEYLLIPIGLIWFWMVRKKMRILALSTIMLPFVYYFLKIEQPIHYHLIIAANLFVILGFILSSLVKSKNIYLRSGTIIFTFLILTASLVFNYSFFSLVRRHNGLAGDYGEIYSHKAAFIQKTLSAYRNDPAYREMYLSEFIDMNYFKSTDPVPRMLYDRNDIQNRLPQLFNRLSQVPVDIRAMHQLMFYYSNPPNIKSLRDISAKSQTDTGYAVFLHAYFDTYMNYVAAHGTQYVNAKKSKFSFEIPQNWQWQDTDEGVMIKADTFSLYLHRNPEQTLIKSRIIIANPYTLEISPAVVSQRNELLVEKFTDTIADNQTR